MRRALTLKGMPRTRFPAAIEAEGKGEAIPLFVLAQGVRIGWLVLEGLSA